MESKKEPVLIKNNFFSEWDKRESKILYYVINLIPVLILMIRFFSVRGLMITLVLSGILWFVMAVKGDVERRAASYLSFMLFLDACIVIGIFSETFQTYIKVENLASFWSNITIQTIICLCIGFIMGLISIQKSKMYWLSWVAAELIGIAVILQLFGNGDLLSPILKEGGKEILTLFIVGAGMWFFISQISILFDWEKKETNIRMGFVLLLAVMFLLITEKAYINKMLPDIILFYQNLSASVFAWWKVLLSVGVLVVLGIALLQDCSEKKNSVNKEDGVVCCLMATGVLVVKLLMTNHFVLNRIVFFVFVLTSFLFVKHVNNKTITDEELIYLGSQPFIIIGVIKLLEWGLWMNVVVTAVFAVLFYEFYKNRKKLLHKQKTSLFIYILIAIAAETIVWIWALCFQIDKIVMVGVILAVSISAVLILDWSHPDRRQNSDKYKMVICIVFGILCLISINKYGSKIATDFNEEQQTISITTEARGKDNKVENITCIWTDQFGQQVGDEISFKKENKTFKIEAETLTIIAVDQNGVTTVRKERFPYWMIVSQ